MNQATPSEGGLERDWMAWHQVYDRPGSSLSWRLGVVQSRIRAALDQLPAGPIRVISLCAGQGHDLIGALTDHPRRHDVGARLVELDAGNTRSAREAARRAGLEHFQVITGDASLTAVYEGAVPAHLLLACGVFGNISDADIHTTISALPCLAATDAIVIWTRHRHLPDLTPQIRDWFRQAGFEQMSFDSLPGGYQTVGVHRLTGPTQPFRSGLKLFHFVGYDNLLR